MLKNLDPLLNADKRRAVERCALNTRAERAGAAFRIPFISLSGIVPSAAV
ncbi:hypothetical protein [Burkholderia sp. Bp8963]|nr:hypothetical protein [Burkholderia sp. Bp8963]